jgi:hypothetical protein
MTDTTTGGNKASHPASRIFLVNHVDLCFEDFPCFNVGTPQFTNDALQRTLHGRKDPTWCIKRACPPAQSSSKAH